MNDRVDPTEPQASEPQGPEPQASEPQASEPQASEPQASEPNELFPASEPGSRPPTPEPAGPETPSATWSPSFDTSMPVAPARGVVVVIHAGRQQAYSFEPGNRMVLGRAADCSLAIDDPRLSPHHLHVERRGPGWIVGSLDPWNPAMLLDDTGRARPIIDELGLLSGQLLAGDVQVLLLPPSS